MVSGISRHVDAIHTEWLVHACAGRETDRDGQAEMETERQRQRETD